MPTATRNPKRTVPLSVEVRPVKGESWTIVYPSNRNPGKTYAVVSTLMTVGDLTVGSTFCPCPGTAIKGNCWHRDDSRVALARHGATRVDGQPV